MLNDIDALKARYAKAGLPYPPYYDELIKVINIIMRLNQEKINSLQRQISDQIIESFPWGLLTA